MGRKTKKVDIIDFLRNIVTVNSKSYKKHVRAKRGTYTEITLPDALKANSDSQKIINRQAKLVFDKIKEIEPRFKDGKLWSRLLSALRKNGSAATGQGYLRLTDFDVRKDYPCSRIIIFAAHFDDIEPHFAFQIFGAHGVAIHLCVLEVDDAFEQVVGRYEWEFAVAGSDRFDFDGIAEFRLHGKREWDEGDGSAISEIGVGDGGLVVDESGALLEFGGPIKEFVYDPEKKGSYIGIFSFNKVENDELRTVLANQAMKLIGF